MKLPSFQFYPGDWMKDPALRSVSVAARGLWMDMICLMHECPKRGYLQHANGSPITDEQLSRISGVCYESVRLLLGELLDCGVASKNGETVFCRRIVRDEASRQAKSAAGRAGMAVRYNRTVTPTLTPTLTDAQQKGGSSSSSSTSVEVHTNRKGVPRSLDVVKGWVPHIPNATDTDAEMFWSHYEANDWVTGSGQFVTNAREKFRSWVFNKSIKPTAAARPQQEAPLWQQKKAAEELLKVVDADLAKIPLPDANLYPQENAAAAAKRKPLVEKKKTIVAKLKDLNERMLK